MGTKGIVRRDVMNDMLEDMILQGLTGLRQMLAGKHQKPQELALTMVIVAAQPERAEAVLLDSGAQARWEVVHNGEA